MDADAARPVARLVAWGRIGIGAGAVLAPSLWARPWIGADAGAPGSRLLARAMGGRDLALGVGALRGLGRSDGEARPWVALGGMADAVDALATLVAFGSLPRRRRWGILALTAGAAVVSTRVAVSLDTEQQGFPLSVEPTVPGPAGVSPATAADRV